MLEPFGIRFQQSFKKYDNTRIRKRDNLDALGEKEPLYNWEEQQRRGYIKRVHVTFDTGFPWPDDMQMIYQSNDNLGYWFNKRFKTMVGKVVDQQQDRQQVTYEYKSTSLSELIDKVDSLIHEVGRQHPIIPKIVSEGTKKIINNNDYRKYYKTINHTNMGNGNPPSSNNLTGSMVTAAIMEALREYNSERKEAERVFSLFKRKKQPVEQFVQNNQPPPPPPPAGSVLAEQYFGKRQPLDTGQEFTGWKYEEPPVYTAPHYPPFPPYQGRKISRSRSRSRQRFRSPDEPRVKKGKKPQVQYTGTKPPPAPPPQGSVALQQEEKEREEIYKLFGRKYPGPITQTTGTSKPPDQPPQGGVKRGKPRAVKVSDQPQQLILDEDESKDLLMEDYLGGPDDKPDRPPQTIKIEYQTQLDYEKLGTEISKVVTRENETSLKKLDTMKTQVDLYLKCAQDMISKIPVQNQIKVDTALDGLKTEIKSFTTALTTYRENFKTDSSALVKNVQTSITDAFEGVTGELKGIKENYQKLEKDIGKLATTKQLEEQVSKLATFDQVGKLAKSTEVTEVKQQIEALQEAKDENFMKILKDMKDIMEKMNKKMLDPQIQLTGANNKKDGGDDSLKILKQSVQNILLNIQTLTKTVGNINTKGEFELMMTKHLGVLKTQLEKEILSNQINNVRVEEVTAKLNQYVTIAEQNQKKLQLKEAQWEKQVKKFELIELQQQKYINQLNSELKGIDEFVTLQQGTLEEVAKTNLNTVKEELKTQINKLNKIHISVQQDLELMKETHSNNIDIYTNKAILSFEETYTNAITKKLEEVQLKIINSLLETPGNVETELKVSDELSTSLTNIHTDIKSILNSSKESLKTQVETGVVKIEEKQLEDIIVNYPRIETLIEKHKPVINNSVTSESITQLMNDVNSVLGLVNTINNNTTVKVDETDISTIANKVIETLKENGVIAPNVPPVVVLEEKMDMEESETVGAVGRVLKETKGFLEQIMDVVKNQNKPIMNQLIEYFKPENLVKNVTELFDVEMWTVLTVLTSFTLTANLTDEEIMLVNICANNWMSHCAVLTDQGAVKQFMEYALQAKFEPEKFLTKLKKISDIIGENNYDNTHLESFKKIRNGLILDGLNWDDATANSTLRESQLKILKGSPFFTGCVFNSAFVAQAKATKGKIEEIAKGIADEDEKGQRGSQQALANVSENIAYLQSKQIPNIGLTLSDIAKWKNHADQDIYKEMIANLKGKKFTLGESFLATKAKHKPKVLPLPEKPFIADNFESIDQIAEQHEQEEKSLLQTGTTGQEEEEDPDYDEEYDETTGQWEFIDASRFDKLKVADILLLNHAWQEAETLGFPDNNVEFVNIDSLDREFSDELKFTDADEEFNDALDILNEVVKKGVIKDRVNKSQIIEIFTKYKQDTGHIDTIYNTTADQFFRTYPFYYAVAYFLNSKYYYLRSDMLMEIPSNIGATHIVANKWIGCVWSNLIQRLWPLLHLNDLKWFPGMRNLSATSQFQLTARMAKNSNNQIEVNNGVMKFKETGLTPGGPTPKEEETQGQEEKTQGQEEKTMEVEPKSQPAPELTQLQKKKLRIRKTKKRPPRFKSKTAGGPAVFKRYKETGYRQQIGPKKKRELKVQVGTK